MELKPKLNLDAYEASFKAIDTHTVGEFTRILFSGFPELKGDTPIERKNYLHKNYDKYRQALMFEPRGHHDMFGAYVTEPISKEADFAVFFMDTGEYLNMCGHGTIGTVTALIESGLVEAKEPFTEVTLEAPAGIIKTKAEVKDGKVLNVTLTNVPAFLYKENLKTTIDGKEITYDISFGGSFFALVKADQLGMAIEPKNIPALTDFGMKMIEAVNKEVEMKHPTLDITTVDLCEIYSDTDTPGADKRNVVIFGDRMADRSPCGTGTSAKLATLYARDEIGIGEPFVYESFIGSQFKGVILEETNIGDFKAVVPQITGSAYVTGEATYVIDGDDPLKYGFVVG
ncbi:proline racemase family protein [Ohessyouella blattaphilus]|uniref:Proline racemase family protein n=1 Tax=Ohessyouella blattaphilus TaxID=2949333 RepID=A0ABT1EMS6_9FIRM|nr:proline racemase family protein [Ohessyouella blattaphilus]MCP1110582.1 proline racemase family protein [Ohessyouella blattaphilus]MCR8563976.1 proline racemase family protein [Ohessyouella blattaphilus]MDL2249574.1 proline racemase family protein [Lachnospiraceae bacterium OttesenSCG-928-J05]